MSRPRVILVLVAAALAHPGPARAHLCNNNDCECNPAAHPSWTLINCTIPHHKNVKLMEGDVPEMTTELNITGGNNVEFSSNSLSRLKDVRILQIKGVKSVILRKFAAVNLNAVSVYMDVQDCEFLLIEANAFNYLKGPLSATIANCDVVSIDGEAFSWLLSISISDVHELQLGPGTFVLDPTAANIGLHGPSLVIELINVTVSEFPRQTFGSSAASIMLKKVVVRDIMPEAFTANTYNRFEAYNSRFDYIHGGAFDQKTVIHLLLLNKCTITRFASGAVQSAVAVLNITESKFEHVDTGAVNATVASVYIADSEFINFEERGLELSSSNKINMRRNKFDELPPNAIIAVGSIVNELIFTENEIETVSKNSLAFIGKTRHIAPNNVIYLRNYYGQPCYCNISKWLGEALGSDSGAPFHTQSFCTIDPFIGQCFVAYDQNVLVSKYLDGACTNNPNFSCSSIVVKSEDERVEIKNNRFPHKKKYEGISERNKKTIAIVIVAALVCVIIAMLMSLIKWMNRNGYCAIVKNFLITCGNFCNRICCCGNNRGIDTARSISQLSIHEYSERHRLNETRMFQETALSNMYEMDVLVEDKMTQTLPEELTKELLENLKDQLDDPNNYKEAREMIEHLYELIKVEDVCHKNTPVQKYGEENFYELPIINTMPRIGKNKKNLVSIGTKVPSLEKLMPLSPYNRTTALVHEYFEPKDLKDMAVHLYAEITNDKTSERSKGVPSVYADVVPRGPYLNAIRGNYCPAHLSTIKSNKSNKSNGSGHMINRPLPEKPTTFDPGEGSSSSR